MALVVLQNALRAGAPGNDASPAEVIRYFHDHHNLAWLLAVLFVVNGFALARYCGGLWHGVTGVAPEARDWLVTGLLGVAGIVATFSAMVACEVGLDVAARRSATAQTVVPTLWTLHNALFAVLNVVIGIALLGLSRASVAARLAPRAFLAIGTAGAGLLAVGACFAPAIADTNSPAMAFAGLGFLCWLAFVAVSGWRMLRLDTPVMT